jgi:outer membrane immunogenic protein
VNKVCLRGCLFALLGVSVPAFAGEPAPGNNWSGWYLGVNAGDAWSDADFLWSSRMASPAVNAQINAIAPTTMHPAGFAGGGQIGFNYQTGALVWGAEADLAYTGLKAERSVGYLAGVNPNTISESVESNWLATLRGRLGLANGPWLLYATGGLAVGGVNYRDSEFFSINGQVFAASSSATRTGWTAGGGIERALPGGWSVKAEYLFVDLGHTNYTSVGSINPANSIVHNHSFNENIVRLGLNYNFDPANSSVYQAPGRGPLFSWAGFYGGVNAGGAFGNADFDWLSHQASAAVNAQINAIASTTMHPSSFTGGGQIGFNYQTGALVWGAESDLDYTGLKAHRSLTYIGVVTNALNTINQSVESDWLATLRGRLGLVNGPWLFYGTGGLAVSGVNYRDSEFFSDNGQVFAASSSRIKAGWTAGGGIERALFGGWSVKAEYLFVDLGRTNYTSIGSINPANSIVHDHRFTENIVRLGVNYKFNSTGG